MIAVAVFWFILGVILYRTPNPQLYPYVYPTIFTELPQLMGAKVRLILLLSVEFVKERFDFPCCVTLMLLGLLTSVSVKRALMQGYTKIALRFYRKFSFFLTYSQSLSFSCRCFYPLFLSLIGIYAKLLND